MNENPITPEPSNDATAAEQMPTLDRTATPDQSAVEGHAVQQQQMIPPVSALPGPQPRVQSEPQPEGPLAGPASVAQTSGAQASGIPASEAPEAFSGHHAVPAGSALPAPLPQPSRRRASVGMLVAGLAIGAIVGGASGAGAFAIIDHMNPGTSVGDSAGGSKSITINDTGNVSQTTAIAAKASPSVVTIGVASDSSAGSGSGIVLSKDGYVLTNNHVVTLDGTVSNPTIQVTDDAGNIYSGTIVGTDPVYDLAVIKLKDAKGMTPMAFADSSKLNVGDAAVAIGAPLGLAGTVTDGIVSALNRSITVASSAVPGNSDENDSDDDQWGFNLPGQKDSSTQQSSISLAVIQTDAAINPGNSGGALLNDTGELIGVNVAIASAGSESTSQSGSIGVGFAIPSNIAQRIAEEIISTGAASHGLLGAQVKDSASEAKSSVTGALIDKVGDGGAAAKAGLKSGDIVTAVGNTPISNATDLTAQVRAAAAGSTITVTYVRDGVKKSLDITLGSL